MKFEKEAKFLTKDEAAVYLGISLRTIDRMITNREIPFYKYGDTKRSLIRLSLTDLVKWVARYRNEAEIA